MSPSVCLYTLKVILKAVLYPVCTDIYLHFIMLPVYSFHYYRKLYECDGRAMILALIFNYSIKDFLHIMYDLIENLNGNNKFASKV